MKSVDWRWSRRSRRCSKRVERSPALGRLAVLLSRHAPAMMHHAHAMVVSAVEPVPAAIAAPAHPAHRLPKEAGSNPLLVLVEGVPQGPHGGGESAGPLGVLRCEGAAAFEPLHEVELLVLVPVGAELLHAGESLACVVADGGLDRLPEPLLIGREPQAGLDAGDAGIDEPVEIVLRHAGTFGARLTLLTGSRSPRTGPLRDGVGAGGGDQGRGGEGDDLLHLVFLHEVNTPEIAPAPLSSK